MLPGANEIKMNTSDNLIYTGIQVWIKNQHWNMFLYDSMNLWMFYGIMNVRWIQCQSRKVVSTVNNGFGNLTPIPSL